MQNFITGILYYIFIFSALDVTLTYYQFFLMQKKDVYDSKCEKNPLARIFFKNGISPLKMLFTYMYTFGIIFIIVWFYFTHLINYGELYVNSLLSIVMGILFTVNMYHIFNIRTYKEFWNDNIFWDHRKHIKIVRSFWVKTPKEEIVG
jgi:hypothetical protein